MSGLLMKREKSEGRSSAQGNKSLKSLKKQDNSDLNSTDKDKSNTHHHQFKPVPLENPNLDQDQLPSEKQRQIDKQRKTILLKDA